MTTAEPMTTEEAAGEVPQDFKLVLAHKRFLYRSTDIPTVDKAKVQKEMLDIIYANSMAATYEAVCEEFGWPVDQAKLSGVRTANAAKLEELESKIKDAEENLGDTEVREALFAKADFLMCIGERAAAEQAFKVTEEKTAGGGQKLDITFAIIRQDIAAGDWHAAKASISKAKRQCEAGGDWERKNRLKVYEALYAMATRDIKRAADLFLDSIATFTTTELFPYETCIFYTVVTCVVALDRVALKKRVVDAPEILTVLHTVPHLGPYLNSLYGCKYTEFMQALVKVSEQLRADEYLRPHLRYYLREIRGVVYSQFLESYKSVTLDSMATAFGVSPAFLDQELADFIVAGRLSAKIDKVAGVIETNRPDTKNYLYQQTIKQGDLLLNRIQKLSKVVDLE